MRDQRVGDAIGVVGVDRAEHRPDDAFADFTGAVGDRLVEHRERVAHRTVRRTRDQRYRCIVERHAFGMENLCETADDQRRRQELQVELQAAREYRDRNFLRIGGRQHELHVLGRLLQGLEHRVERRLRQHVHFVDQVDLVAADRRRITRVVQDLAHVVDAGVRRGVELEQVDEAAGIDVDAGGARAAGRCGHAVRDAIEALGENPGDRGLAHAASAGEQVRVMQPTAFERIRQRLHDMLLARELGERFRPPFAGEDLIGHAEIDSWRAKALLPCLSSPRKRGPSDFRG